MLSTASQWLRSWKQRLTQNLRRLITTQPIVKPKIDFEKKEIM